MKKGIKLLSFMLVLLLTFGMMSACGGTEADKEKEPANSGAANAGRDDAIIAMANEPPTLHPYDHNASAANYMNAFNFATLYRPNLENLEPEKYLAESCEVVTDKQWKLKIKEGVKFHNGETMTTEDVVASMEYARVDYKALTNIYSSWWESLEIIDDTTMLINTKDIYAKTLVDLCHMKIVPKSLIDAGNDFNANPIGAGPYKYVSWTLGDNIQMEAFEDYFEGAPAIKHVTFRIIPEGSSRTIALEAGEIDMIEDVESNDLERLRSSKNITVYEKPGTNFNFLMINNERPPFNNEDFRKAINSAVDKQALVEVALNGSGEPLYTQTPKVFAGHSERNLQSYDLKAAKEYLDKSGIDPASVSFSIICSDDVKRRCGEVIQANLQDIGINAQLESMDLATYLSMTAEGNYDAAIGGYGAPDTMSFVEGVWHSKSINGSNKTRTNDPEIDRLYELAMTQLDAETRNKTLEECCARINEICGQIPTYVMNVTKAYNSGFEGMDFAPNGTLRFENVSWAE